MTIDAIKQFLNTNLIASLTTIPAYPCNGACAVHFNQGYDTTNTIIAVDRPSTDMVMGGKKGIIIIDDLEENEHQKTMGGVNGTIENTHKIMLTLSFYADFVGNPALLTNADYSAELTSNTDFRKWLTMTKQSLRLMKFLRTGVSSYGAALFNITDNLTGLKSNVKDISSRIQTIKAPVRLARNRNSLVYAANITFELTEVYNLLGT